MDQRMLRDLRTARIKLGAVVRACASAPYRTPPYKRSLKVEPAGLCHGQRRLVEASKREHHIPIVGVRDSRIRTKLTAVLQRSSFFATEVPQPTGAATQVH